MFSNSLSILYNSHMAVLYNVYNLPLMLKISFVLSRHHRLRAAEEDAYDKRLVDTESTSSDVYNNKTSNHINSMYTSVNKTTVEHQHMIEGDTDSGAEMYSLDDLPRVSPQHSYVRDGAEMYIAWMTYLG